MEKKPEQMDGAIGVIKPPTESRISTILNGVGNGMMLGAIPLVGIKMYADAKGKAIPHMGKFSAFATITGCAIGGWFGIAESNRMHDYRLAINNEIAKIRDEVNDNSATIKQWSKKLDDRAQPKVANPVTR